MSRQSVEPAGQFPVFQGPGHSIHSPPWGGFAFDNEPAGASERLAPGAGRRREEIYRYIHAHPGSHVRGVAKDLGLATGALQYHLYWLERHGFVTTRRSGFYRYVYPSRVFADWEEHLLGVLSQDTPREILLCLVQRGSLSQRELAEMLKHSQPTVSWHMERLSRAGIVRRTKSSRTVTYDLAVDPAEVLEFVKRYHRAAWERWEGSPGQLAVVPVRMRT